MTAESTLHFTVHCLSTAKFTLFYDGSAVVHFVLEYAAFTFPVDVLHATVFALHPFPPFPPTPFDPPALASRM